ncbi:(Fe-S)-binding protein [Maribellus sediminis]|uniref:(Fe-S)-binding protein n=1 Tax=Maribellus sediminis TaxID=2696285 RepID=UPI001430D5E6|nr:(Fe-S)-binding protein [Maribellus sediminis]
MKIDVFIPCFIDQFYPDTAFNFIKVLEKVGCTVNYNPEQTCCGQPAFNSGYWEEARTVALKFITDFSEANLVVSPSASCSGFIRNYYPELFNDDSFKSKAVLIGKKVVEFSDFLVNQLKVVDVGAEFNHKVTFHDSCAGLREYGIEEEPRKLLARVKGLELVEMDKRTTCCGFGGTFAAKFHNISTAMTEQKVENALKTGAEYIVSTEASCLLNMEAYIRKQQLPIKTVHLADILANGW